MRSLEKRFWEKVSPEPNSGCWLWDAWLTPQGYGQISVGGRSGGPKLAHRVSYEMLRGLIPEGLQLDHLCRVRSCVNPDHLEVVTNQENCARGDCGKKTGARQRAKTHCAKGHPFSPENTYLWRGHRQCRECKRASRRRYYYEKQKRAIVEATTGYEVRIT